MTLAAADDISDVVETYVNFGAPTKTPDAFDCDAWASLFSADGTADAPGAPQSKGTAALKGDCEVTRGLFAHLYAHPVDIHAVPKGMGNRVAFSWWIAGTLNATGARVSVPAMTTWQLDEAGKITAAVDYFDPSSLM